ncbi:hypothetical protein CFN78_24445 [Amycolatopsis antarctica]|uniref:DUF2771 domain-containing protein n=1 Tax=Amycolatopsis antarctica TaxID=1854586 RepID=A0A263CX54_9PSEU|nr:DUF2771 family protein [Amycolatopsis antarctica]OZM70559.1 hypothetical protein CFN78_24445 [Amycolatopsis antarctica]
MRRRAVAGLLAGAAVTVTGCSAPGAPEVSFYADGRTVNAAPLIYCDAIVSSCEQNEGAAAKIPVRAGMPVQISLPSEVAETPWVVNVQYTDAEGNLKPIKQEFFGQDSRLAYTATGDAPGDQVLVVEIQQLGAAYAADATGMPIPDADGNPQLVVRGVWSFQVER